MKNILIVLCMLFATNAFSQETIYAPSKNDNYFVTLTKIKEKRKLVTYELNVFNLFLNTKQRTIKLPQVDTSFVVTEVKISNNGLLCAISSGKNTWVWNMISGKKIQTGKINACYFPNKGDFFICTYRNVLKIYNALTGNLVKQAGDLMDTDVIRNVNFSADDRLIIAETDNSNIVYTSDGNKLKIDGCHHYVTPKHGEMVALTEKNDVFKVVWVNQYTLDVKDVFNLTKYYDRINTPERIKKERLGLEKEESYSIIASESKISEDGGNLILLLAKKDLTGNIVKKLSIIDLKRRENIASVSDEFYKKDLELENYKVHNEHALLLPFGKRSAAVFDLEENKILSSLHFSFYDKEILNTMPESIQEKYLTTCSNWRYSLLQNPLDKKAPLYLKSTFAQHRAVKIEEVRPLCFSNNSKFLFLQNREGEPAFIQTANIATAIGGNKIKVYTFGDGTIPAANEKEIIEEEEPPEYTYTKIKGFKHISELPAKSVIRLHFKTMAIGKWETGLQCHLIDTSGIYYYGASEKKWRHIWKKLVVHFSEDKKARFVEDFRVTETSPKNNQSNAVSLVLDHSGSMGAKRAFATQIAAQGFVRKKEGNDKIAVIKYDGEIGIDTDFTEDKEKLSAQIEINGLRGYGGATALLDAIGIGTDLLNQNNEKANKSVVILTDGGENSSQLLKGDLLKFANYSNVKIHTLGFGSYVDDDYLKALAYYTQGSYFHIYKTSNFDWIFDDIYKKMNHYYTISFKTDRIGEYKAVLEIEIDDLRKDTLSASFTTVPIDYDKLNKEKKGASFTPPVAEEKPDAEEVQELYELVEETDDEMNEIKPIEVIKKEFEQIEFPKIKFISNTSEIVKGTETGIDNTIAFMKKYTKIKIEITGHTDNLGGEAKNRLLSAERARSVKKYMVKKGIDAVRIKVKGVGQERPIADNTTEEGRYKNRRVEFKVVE